ncbi:MAG: hypothetical protein J0L52_02080 [Caulobacterales bacterium]|nr:hypothetical protein [Caulobacterales bacterium]
MKRLICLASFAVLAWPSVGQAQSGSFYLVGLTDQSAWLADRDSIRWSGANPMITLHQIYSTPRPIPREYGSGYELYQRAEFRIAIDCAGNRTRDIGFSMHGFSAGVRPLRLTEQGAWEPIADSALFSDLHGIACHNRIPDNQTPASDLQVAIVAYYQTMNDEED